MLHELTKKVTTIVTDNAPALLTGVGVVGTITTAVLTGRAGYKSCDVLIAKQIENTAEGKGDEKFDTMDKVKAVWHLYVPPVLSGAATIGCIIMAQRLNAQQITALAALYGLQQDRFEEYREKVTEQFGAGKEEKVRTAAAQEQVDNTTGSQVVILGEGEVLCFDKFTGRYFRSTMDRIKKAENAINREIYNYDYASLSSFYDDIGLEPTSQSDLLGWNSSNILEVEYNAVLTKEDERPCIAIDFKYAPKTDYMSGR